MPPPKDFGDALGRFGQWSSDVLFGQKLKPVTPSRQIDYGQMDEDRARQVALYQQLQQFAAGAGPSLAQGQLQQATDQNIRQAMALGAAQQGQGLGYSSALRGIADQSAAARQQAAAQSALIRNQEQMQGLQGMGALGGQMYGQDFARQQLGAQNAYQYDALNAQIAAQNRTPGILPGLLQAGGAILGGALGGPPGAAAGGAAGKALGGGMSVPDVSEPIPMANGGVVVDPKMRRFADYLRAGYRSQDPGGKVRGKAGKVQIELRVIQPGAKAGRGGGGGIRVDPDGAGLSYAGGGAVESFEQERYESPAAEFAETPYQEALEHGAIDRARGGAVPGYARGGDSRRNDTVPAMLSPGEIVIPRSITMAPNAGALSKMFVEMVQQHRSKLPSPDGHPVVQDMMRRKKAA